MIVMIRDDYKTSIVSALHLAISAIEILKENPTPFVEFCAKQQAVAQTVLDKLVAETALFALLAQRCLGQNEIIKTLSLAVAPLVRTESHRSLLHADPTAAAGLALAHTCLELLGFKDDEFGSLLKSCFSKSSSIERPIFREMEQKWLASLSDNAGRPSCDSLLNRSVVANIPVDGDWDDAVSYAFTHEVFYITDFGRYAFPDSLRTRNLEELVDNGIATQVGLNNLDLLAEFSMARCMIGMPPSRAAELGDALLADSWVTYGFLPGPNFKVSEYEQLEPNLQSVYFALGVYHTTYVGALYLITKLRLGGPSPEVEWAGREEAANIRWVPRLRAEDAPILTQILARAPRDMEPVLAKAAAARARIRPNNSSRLG